MAQTIFSQKLAPHFKSEASFTADLARALGGAWLLMIAGFWSGGLNAAVLFGTVTITAAVCEIILRAAGFKSAPTWDAALYHQAALLVLFLPLSLPVPAAVSAAAAMSVIYRISGGRAGLVLPPVCIALAFTALQGYAPVFLLNSIPQIPALILFAAWMALRFPLRRIEMEKTVSVLLLAAMTVLLQDMPAGTALLWSAAAGEILFDGALLPIDSKLRQITRVAAVILMLLFTAVCDAEEALIFCGMTAAFTAAVIERRTAGKYAKT